MQWLHVVSRDVQGQAKLRRKPQRQWTHQDEPGEVGHLPVSANSGRKELFSPSIRKGERELHSDHHYCKPTKCYSWSSCILHLKNEFVESQLRRRPLDNGPDLHRALNPPKMPRLSGSNVPSVNQLQSPVRQCCSHINFGKSWMRTASPGSSLDW